MAKDSSFDVVSEVNMQEVDNAFQQTTREISQRYDLKDSGATIELSKGDKLFTINAPADFVSKQIVDEHGGRIAVQSSPGETTVVSVMLPRLHQSGKEAGEK